MYFFSSRRRHTRWPRDWSSDVCSSDLEYPVAVVTAAGKAPLTAEHEAAIDPLYLADRHIGRREQYAGVFAPDILGGTVVEQPQLPVVNGHHTQHPGTGHAALGQRHLHVIEVLGIQLHASPARGLKDAENACFLKLPNGGLGDVALPFALLGSLGQYRHQLPGPFTQLLSQRIFVMISHCLLLWRIPAVPCGQQCWYHDPDTVSACRPGHHPNRLKSCATWPAA